jgi:hypothetical protein
MSDTTRPFERAALLFYNDTPHEEHPMSDTTAPLGPTSGGDTNDNDTDDTNNNGNNGNGGTAMKPEDAIDYWNRLEIWKPPTDGIRGYLWVEIADPYGVTPANIIKHEHPWIVRCHVWLYGDIWKCVCGKLCLEVCFKPCYRLEGEPEVYSLEHLTGERLCKKFKGCKYFHEGEDGAEGYVHFTMETKVPAGQLPVGKDGRPRAYDWTGTLSFQNPCGDYEAIAGFQSGELAVHEG